MTSSVTKKEMQTLLVLLAYELFQKKLEVDASDVDWTAVLTEGDKQ